MILCDGWTYFMSLVSKLCLVQDARRAKSGKAPSKGKDKDKSASDSGTPSSAAAAAGVCMYSLVIETFGIYQWFLQRKSRHSSAR